MDAAQQEFMRAGYAAANTNTMALNGVSKATIFRHYPTKRVLFEAVVARIAARWSERVDAISITERMPRDWLRAFGMRALQWILSDEALFVGRMAIADGPDHDTVRGIWMAKANDPVMVLLVERMREWQAAGTFFSGDAKRRADMYLDLILAGRVSRALYGIAEPRNSLALQNHVDDCVDLFLYGCGTPMRESTKKRRR